MRKTSMRCSERRARELRAFVADSVWRLLDGEGAGEVLAVNSSGSYLLLEKQVVFICDSVWGHAPLTAAIDGYFDTLPSLRLEQGQPLSFRQGYLFFLNGSIRILPKPSERSHDVTVAPNLERMRQAAESIVRLSRTKGLSMLASPLVLDGDPDTVLALNPYCKKAYPHLIELMQALLSDGEAVRRSVSELLGLGVGLTPSADDVLLGMLYVFQRAAFQIPSLQAYRESIGELCQTHTNRISAAYLKAVLDGAYFERMETVLRGLSGAVPLDVTPLTQIGSNSGAEMLLGMLLALLVLGSASL